MLREGLISLCAALGYFTRLPAPGAGTNDTTILARAMRWFPLIGVLVGTIGGLVTLGCAAVLPFELAVVLGMAATLLATGALHEDGFADTCDGLGGGWDREQILAIMKDPRIGSYGAIGIGLLLLAKWNALASMDTAFLLPALVAGHAVSRLAACSLMYALDYARSDASSKSAPLTGRMPASALAFAALCGLSPCALLPYAEVLFALALVAIVTLFAARTFVRRLGGYTGDCLGATQQTTELAFYIGLLCDFT
jgi:adenosylcobinamide-GDP ribazoletransferase